MRWGLRLRGMRVGLLFVVTVLGAGLVGCEEPPVWAGQDRRQNQRSGRVEGEVVVTGQARGNVVLFLFDVNRPPPPLGTGRPVSFTVISGDELFGPVRNETVSGGPFTAPFAFSLVPEGDYLVRGFLDRDGCLGASTGCRPSDFVPWFGVTSEPNAGDVGGAAVDVLSGAPSVIHVSAQAGEAESSTHVRVSFATSATVPVDRPVFRVTSGDGVVRAEGAVLDLSPFAMGEGPIHEQSPVFLVRFPDANGDGVPDDTSGAKLWPRVFVRKLADDGPALRDENDANNDGILDEGGVDYPHEDGALDGQPDRVLLEAGVDPTNLLPLLNDEQGAPTLKTVQVTQLRVIIRPVALDAANPEAPVKLQRLPKGRYAVTLMQLTGQTWRLPNELQPGVAEGAGLPAVDSQSFTVTVP